ncbi:MAG: GAF and ANTAR domain-containing protein [Nocardioidaceae bacterium]
MVDLPPDVAPGAPTWEVFHNLAHIIYAADDFDTIFDAAVRAAPDVVAGCDHASLMVRQGEQFLSIASSDAVAAAIDTFERELGEGPCVDAIEDDSSFHDSDLTNGSPWPRLAERVLAETDVRGMAGFRLKASDGVVGALNLFSDVPGALTEEGLEQGMVLASFVNLALTAAHERRAAATLRAGLESNREIGKAIGLMMAFHKISDDAAFALLRRTSQDMNLKLRDVARKVVDHHNQV